MKILLIEDDVNLKKYIKEYLSAYDYVVESINDFSESISSGVSKDFDLIILDINLPKFDGFYYLKIIRKKSKIPIIILSSRSDESDQIRGMELGADDYVLKPFSIGILIAKINALLRRHNVYKSESVFDSLDKNGELILIHDSMKLKYKDEILELSKNEYKILNILMSNVGKVISRQELLENLWDDSLFVDDNTLTVNMTRVKKKLEQIGIKDAIITKRGVGYVFNKINN